MYRSVENTPGCPPLLGLAGKHTTKTRTLSFPLQTRWRHNVTAFPHGICQAEGLNFRYFFSFFLYAAFFGDFAGFFPQGQTQLSVNREAVMKSHPPAMQYKVEFIPAPPIGVPDVDLAILYLIYTGLLLV